MEKKQKMSELYKLPAGWEWKKLGDKKVCNLIMGQSPSSKSYNSNGIGKPFFQGKKEFGDLYPTVEHYTTEPKKIAEKGDILLSVRAPVGPTNIADIQCCIGRGLSAISPNKNNTITNYLLYFFRNFELTISNKGKGSTFSAITKKELEETDIPLPPLAEQKRIVAKLDSLFEKIDKAIELHQQNITNANTLMASTLDKTFKKLATNKRYKLGDKKVCNLVMGQSPSSKSYNSNGIGIPFFQGKKEFGDLYPTVEHYTTEPKKIAEKGDILLSVRAPVGPTNIANVQCCIGRGLSAISPNKENSLTNYLLYFFRDFELIISNKGKGSTFSAITKKDLEDVHVPLPPLPIQQQTVAYLDSIATKVDEIKKLNEQKLENLKALKASILDRAFRGEL